MPRHFNLRRKIQLVSALSLTALAGCDGAGSGTTGLTASGGLVGEAVDVSAETAVLGAVASNDAFVFEHVDRWTLTETLTPSRSSTSNPSFAQSVDLDGPTLAVGAPHFSSGTETGTVYVYERSGTGWDEAAVLRPEGLPPDARFGGAVGLSGDHLAVGTVRDRCVPQGDGQRCGSVRIFSRASEWGEEQLIENPAPPPYNTFARDLSIDGATLAVSAISNSALTSRPPGTIALFTRGADGWAPVWYVQAPAGAGPSFAESALALDGPLLAVSEIGFGPDGSVHVFRRAGSGWSLEARLGEPDLGPLALYGRRIALNGDVLVVAVTGREYAGRPRGAAFVYRRASTGEWSREAELRAPDESIGFGRDVAISGERIVVGANNGEDSGRAFAFVRRGGTWEIED